MFLSELLKKDTVLFGFTMENYSWEEIQWLNKYENYVILPF